MLTLGRSSWAGGVVCLILFLVAGSSDTAKTTRVNVVDHESDFPTHPKRNPVPLHIRKLNELSLSQRPDNFQEEVDEKYGSYTYYYNDTYPRQVRLSVGQVPTTTTVTWSTRNTNNNATTFVQYSTNPSSFSSNSSDIVQVKGDDPELFFQLNWELSDSQWIHTVSLEGLNATTTYYYRCGSEDSYWSDVFHFTTLPLPGDPQPLQYAVYGDWGYNMSSKSLDLISDKTTGGFFDIHLFVGDISYDLDSHNGLVGDRFLEMVEPISSSVTVQVCPGNHEEDTLATFHNYRHRFRMPGWQSSENMYYSYDVGLAHIVSFSSEHYYTLPEEILDLAIAEQYLWLEQDLQAANANRANVPWIILMGHRPMYCSDINKRRRARDLETFTDCTSDTARLREGLPVLPYVGLPPKYGMEPLLWEYGVDLYLSGHEHSYERLFPVYDSTVMNGTTVQNEPYTDPGAPVHVITGSAGCKEMLEDFAGPAGPWSAVRSTTFGFGQMKIFNSSHLLWEQILDLDGSVLDDFMLVKNSHGPYGNVTTA